MKNYLCRVILLIVAMLSLGGCGNGGGVSDPGFAKGIGWYLQNQAPDFFPDGATCALNLYVYYSDAIASSDIESFSFTDENGGGWTVPASGAYFGVSRSGSRYMSTWLVYDPNPDIFPIKGTWTARIKLKDGRVSAVQRTLREPGTSTAPTHSYVYNVEDYTPGSNASLFVPNLHRFPSSGYSLTYSSTGGGIITSTGFNPIRSNYLWGESRAYNMFCLLYDQSKTLIAVTNPVYSTTNHSPGTLLSNWGELQISSGTIASSASSSFALSNVKYARIAFMDGVQYTPSSYGSYDYMSLSGLVPVN